MKNSILVVDDEADLVNLVRYNLQKEGYEVFTAYDGSTALELAWDKNPDLIVLDLMLPDFSGFDICQKLKAEEKSRDIPIIMLTARSAEKDRISGFELGAEDYVVKPFSPKELVLRVKAILARTGKSVPNKMQFGPLSIYPEAYRACIHEQEVPLTRNEFKFLYTLSKYPNVVRTREQILEEVWQEEAINVTDRAVDAHVKRLRAKLGELRNCIETVHGIGYRFIDPSAKLQEAEKPTPVEVV